MTADPRCARCECPLVDPEVWPGVDGDVCQVCWETECAESFWQAAGRVVVDGGFSR